MWFHEAEKYVTWATTALLLCCFVWYHYTERKEIVRTIALMLIALGVGLYVGIEKTATGSFNLPLGVMQKQLHEVWGLPLQNLQRPEDK
jgi:heme A synthase